MKNYRIGQNILPTEWHFVKSAKMAVYPPYKNPVFPPFRLTGRKYGILMKEYFDIKKAFDTSLGQTDTKPKPLSSWQETNGQQKAKITFFGQKNLAWKKEANRKNKTEKRGFPSRHSPFLCHLRRLRKSISAKRKIAFSRTIFRIAQKSGDTYAEKQYKNRIKIHFEAFFLSRTTFFPFF